ncbi:hypothetical protein KEM52_002909 [Ascosphaera acerosa]|nr:hypothetical protein KEM52_002909 [Ascosphaera acerosa]
MMAAPSASAVTSLIAAPSVAGADSGNTDAVALQVLHNLQHQHQWTNLALMDVGLSGGGHLIRGYPPHPVYVHPDEQARMVELGLRADDVPVEPEWVLPTTQGQSWTLRRLAEVFDKMPPRSQDSFPEAAAATIANELVQQLQREKATQGWASKRVLLAMVNTEKGGDGTVVYYVMLEGAVKPRQN